MFLQLFVLQIVLRMGLFACNFSCSKSCSRWVFSRATFCGPDRAPDGSFRVQLFVLQIVLQMGLSASFCAHFFGPGVQEFEQIIWFHFACCSHSVIACTRKYFFWQAALFSSWLNKQKKCAAHAACLSLIYVCYIFRATFCGVNSAHCYRQ